MRKDELITLLVAVAALQTAPLASPLSAGHHKQNTNSNVNNVNNIVFQVDNNSAMSISLGSRKAKRRAVTAARRARIELNSLVREREELHKQVLRLEAPRRHAQEDELKRLKRRKLFLRDKMAARQQRARELEATNTGDSAHDTVVGSGGFANVYLAHRMVLPTNDDDAIVTGEPVAVKVARSPLDNAALMQEANFIQRLNRYTGFVRVHHRETLDLEHTGVGAVVMDLLGPSLEDLWWTVTAGAGGLTAATVLRLADDLLPCLMALRSVGLVHRDIQPANILMGRTGRFRRIPHLIDFGIAAEIGGNSHSTDENAVARHAFSGTPRFASVSALQQHGGGGTAADDLESLCYTLAFLLTGTSPWSQYEDNAITNKQTEGAWVLSSLKATVDPFLLCGEELKNEPAAIAIGSLLEHARSCQTEQSEPNYKECRLIVKKALKDLQESSPNKVLPRRFDWEDTTTWSEETGVLVNELYSSEES